MWDVTSGEKVLALSDKGAVNSIAWSPDGSQIATGIVGNTATLWDANSGKLLRKLQGHTDNSQLAGLEPGRAMDCHRARGRQDLGCQTRSCGVHSRQDAEVRRDCLQPR